MFRSEKFLEKTEFMRFGLDKPITIPGNDQFQAKSGYKFSVTDRDNWFDWYNAYIRADFAFEVKADGTAVAGDTQSAPINGSFSLINKLVVKSAGKPLYNVDNAHKLIFIKNLLDFSDDYSRSVAKSQFWYLDTANDDRTAAASTNEGAKARGALAHGGLTVNTIIPLNRYSFFEELSDKLLPPMPLELEIQLQSDEELIWQNNNTTHRRIVVKTLELWVPMLRFTSEGQMLANEDFLKPRKWTYMSEMVEPSTSQSAAFGTWQISPGIKNAKHVFIFIQQTRRVNALPKTRTFLTLLTLTEMTQQSLLLAGFAESSPSMLKVSKKTYLPSSESSALAGAGLHHFTHFFIRLKLYFKLKRHWRQKLVTKLFKKEYLLRGMIVLTVKPPWANAPLALAPSFVEAAAVRSSFAVSRYQNWLFATLLE
ncbi:hypothetical protein ACROYT_G013902 [Oculina patagonica]